MFKNVLPKGTCTITSHGIPVASQIYRITSPVSDLTLVSNNKTVTTSSTYSPEQK